MTSINPLLPPAPAHPSRDDPAKIEHAAKGFESLLIGQILKSAHTSGSAWAGSDDDDPAGESATELAEEQFAQALAASGGLGLSKLITQGLTADSETKVAR